MTPSPPTTKRTETILDSTKDDITEMMDSRWSDATKIDSIGYILLTLTTEIIAQRKEIDKLHQELNEKTDPRLFE